jgi:dihydroorotase
VHEGVFTLSDALARLSHLPAQVLGLRAGTLAPGRPADVCVIDPNYRWRLDPDTLLSAGHNTPFGGWEFVGKVDLTLLNGEIVYRGPTTPASG